MGPSIANTNSKTRTATRRRGAKALCEALEERQLMSLTIEVRDTGGGASTTVNTVGQVVSLKVLAVVTDSANDPSLDGVQDVSGDFLSTAVYGHAVAGNLAAANLAPFKANGASPGTQTDLNGDGNLDVGINYATAPSTAGLFFARSSPVQTGGSGTGTISGNSLIFQIGTLSYTVTNLNKGGETSINFSPYVPPDGEPDAAGWVEDGNEKDNTNGTFQAGTPYIVSDPALVVAPVGEAFSATVTKNTPTIINELSVDDVIVPLNDASVTITGAVSHGVTALQTNGSILYTPNNNYLGTDSFTYTVADTDGRVSNPATVTITVVPAPPPVAVADAATTLLNEPVTISVLANDTVTAPATLVPSSVAILTGASHGTAVAQTNGTVLYTPTTGFTGTDTFTYTVTDTNAETSAAGTVTVTVETPVPPVVPTNTPESTTAGAPVTIDLTTLATAGTSPLSLTSIVIVTPPTDGTAAPQTNGSILYTPTPGFTGTDSFTYTIADTTGLASNIGTISVTITHGVPPVAGDVTAPALAGQANSIVVLNSANNTGAPLLPSGVTVVTQPTNGQATVNASNGTIIYTPDAGYIGTDSFTYTLENTNLDNSNTATVNVDVGTSISNAKGVAHSLSFTDAAGGAETLSINTGTAEIFFSGTGSLTTTGTKSLVVGTDLNIGSITLTGTTKASTLSVKGSVKTQVTVGAITDASPLGGINAASASIVEQNVGGSGSTSVIAGETVNLDSVGTLVLGNISGANITIGAGAPGKVAITAGVVSDTTLTSAVPITAIKAASWTTDSGDTITAPSIGTLTVPGAFGESLTLSGAGKAPDLASAKLTGEVAGGTWQIAGSVGAVTMGSVDPSWGAGITGSLASMTVKTGGMALTNSELLTAGAIGTLSIGGSLSNNIFATSAKSIRISGGISGAELQFSGAAGLKQLTVGGAITSSQITTTGSIGSIAAGSFSASIVNAGVSNAITVSNATAGLLGDASIGSIKVTSPAADAFAGTNILAARIGSASLGNINTDNSSTTFGIATTKLSSFVAVFGSTAIKAAHNLLLNEEVLQQYIQSQGAQLGDASIELLS